MSKCYQRSQNKKHTRGRLSRGELVSVYF